MVSEVTAKTRNAVNLAIAGLKQHFICKFMKDSASVLSVVLTVTVRSTVRNGGGQAPLIPDI
jgi:hypothetical protein